jgi:hypothetical protein
MPPVQRFNFKIDPHAPTKDLLPAAPKAAPGATPVLTDDLAKIPEVAFEAKPEKVTNDDKLTRQAAHQLAKINHLNAKKTDAFMTALLDNRPDLAGMPFRMGDDCRSTGDRAKYFNQAANLVRQALANAQIVTNPQLTPQPAGSFLRANTLSAPTSFVPALAAETPPPAAQAPDAPPAGTPADTVVRVQPTPQAGGPVVQSVAAAATVVSAPLFWQQYGTLCDQEDAARARTDKETVEHVTLARLAALTQMLAAESAEMRLGLVKYLTATPHVEATRALARTVLYSPEEDVRAAAITALKVRREKDYTAVLVTGLQYPWPAVARRAADALAKLERTDLIPELLAVLDAADPRLPELKEADGKVRVREMVKLNHHRNCMMCHAPSGSGAPGAHALQAEVAVQGQPLPQPSEGYRQSNPELMIRVDVTYLRPDFSATLPVKDAQPWPEAQRFDFLVRERTLTADEAAAFRETLALKEEGVLSPYHKAALAALRDLTGKDTAPTAGAWRKLLNLPARQ